MASRSAFLAKIIGLYCVFFALSMFVWKDATIGAVMDLIHEPALVMVLAMTLLVAGLAIVLSHNVWSGGAVPIIVTVLGWLTLIKGLLLLFMGPDTRVMYVQVIRYQELFYLYAVITLVVGLYLTWGGFRMGKDEIRS